MRCKKVLSMICVTVFITMFFTACNIFNKNSNNESGKNTNTTNNEENTDKGNTTPSTPSSGTSVKQDILNYVNKELANVASIELDAVDAYSSVSGENYTSDEEMYDMVKNTVIPEYRDFLNKLKSIKPKTKEVQQIHQIYVNAADTQYSAFVQIAKALENQDVNLINQANDKLSQARAGIENFQNKLNELARKNGVTLN